jgi:WD40 repeat protein
VGRGRRWNAGRAARSRSRLAAGGRDGTLKIWNSDGTDEPLVLRGHQNLVWSVAFSPDGRLLASAGEDGRGLRLWRTDTGVDLVTYRGLGASVEQADFAGDRHRLVSAHDDGTIRVWSCEVCGPVEQVRALAASRVTRTLTADERRVFGSSPP